MRRREVAKLFQFLFVKISRGSRRGERPQSGHGPIDKMDSPIIKFYTTMSGSYRESFTYRLKLLRVEFLINLKTFIFVTRWLILSEPKVICPTYMPRSSFTVISEYYTIIGVDHLISKDTIYFYNFTVIN